MTNYLIFALPLAIGFAGVVQGGLNQEIMKNWGITGAVLINNLQVLFWSLLIWYLARHATGLFPEEWRPLEQPNRIYWWYIIPGLSGFLIVAGIPIAIEKVGAGKTFMAILLAQLIGGVAWDFFVDGKAIEWRQFAGLIAATIGAVLMFK